jgi:hypothetical protein
MAKLLACNIDSCDSLRLGISVNTLFLLLGIGVVAMMDISLFPPGKKLAAVTDEFKAQRAHAGYALFLVAGCAFFGAFSVKVVVSRLHVPFALAWLFILAALLLIEMTASHVRQVPKPFTMSRKLAIAAAAAFIWWAWIGADWPEF